MPGLFGATGVLLHLKEGLFDGIEQPPVDAWQVGAVPRCVGQGTEEKKQRCPGKSGKLWHVLLETEVECFCVFYFCVF